MYRSDRLRDGLRGRGCNRLCQCNWWHSGRCHRGRAAVPLLRQDGEVLLPAVERVDFLACGALEVHSEPHRPDEQPDHARRDVLCDLAALLAGEILDFFLLFP